MKLFSSTLLLRLTYIGLPLLIVLSCKKDDPPPPPTTPAVTTAVLTNITTSSATAGGTILTDGNAAVTQSGIVWSKTNTTPTLADSVIAGTTAKGSFTTNLTGLDFNTVYYIRAFATNSVGTGYGDVVMLNTVNDTSKVRFTYNGKEVIYGIIISSVTGKKWLDRNLGASQVAASYDDYKGYGDLFQWGRPDDGHQLMNWTSSTTGTPVNGISTELATSDTPGHNNFITPPSYNDFPYYRDWRSDNTSSRWATSPQGPCPAGWHVPSMAEWMAEVAQSAGGTANSGGMTDRGSAYNQLKLTVAGARLVDGLNSVNFYQAGKAGDYWSTSQETNSRGVLRGIEFNPGSTYIQTSGLYNSSALCVRCLVN